MQDVNNLGEVGGTGEEGLLKKYMGAILYIQFFYKLNIAPKVFKNKFFLKNQ